MESCTGGLFASTLTDIPGATAYFRGGLVTYHTDLKLAYGVDPAVIEANGVISPAVAVAMAEAVRTRLEADYGVGITGVAGPDPQDGVPAGTVHVAVAGPAGPATMSMQLNQGRAAVKRRAVTTALLLLRKTLLDEGTNER
jgi:PncC family amidohydrolase